MSLLSSLAPVQAVKAAPATGGNPNQTTPNPSRAAGSDAQPKGAASASAGGTAPAEMSMTASRLPPVTASRASNAATSARTGGEGRADATQDRTQADEDAAAKSAEVEAQRKLILKELMSRIPVPVDAIPKLTGDVEVMRTIGEPETRPAYDSMA